MSVCVPPVFVHLVQSCSLFSRSSFVFMYTTPLVFSFSLFALVFKPCVSVQFSFCEFLCVVQLMLVVLLLSPKLRM